MSLTFLKQRCSIKNSLAVNEFSEPTFGNYEDIKCRLEISTQYIRDENGKTAIADALLFLKPDQEIRLDSLVEDEETEQFKVVRIDSIRNFKGQLHHKEVYLRFTDQNE